MEADDLLRVAVETCDRLGITYLVAGVNAEGVSQQSPGSRSAPWVTVDCNDINPNGVVLPSIAM